MCGPSGEPFILPYGPCYFGDYLFIIIVHQLCRFGPFQSLWSALVPQYDQDKVSLAPSLSLVVALLGDLGSRLCRSL